MRRIKKLGKVFAGSALLIGATIAGGAGLATAQNQNTMDLGDYPSPFVDDDGEVDTSVVVGESAKTVDVVGALNIAGSLGNAAHAEEQVSADGGSFGFSATNGVTLDTSNDQLYFGDSISSVRNVLTSDHLDVLETVEVLNGDAEQEVEQYLYVGDQDVEFGTPGDTDEDPFLYVNNPENPSDVTTETGYLYKLQANFQDGVAFQDTDNDDDRNDDVYGEDVTMFGMDYTVAEASFSGSNDGQLVLFGSSQDIDVSDGESSTVSVDGNEHTVETVAVTASDAAAIRIDGTLEQIEEGDEFDVSGETLRVDTIIDTGEDGSGVVKFGIGSEKVVLEDGQPVMTGTDEEDVDGTYVSLSGSNVDGDVDTDDVELSSVEVAVGADDSDNSYVAADEGFEDPVFDDLEFQFAGLNPDTAEESDSTGELTVEKNGDTEAKISFMADSGDSVTQDFIHNTDSDDGSLNSGDSATDHQLADSDNDDIVVAEDNLADENDYIVTDAGDFAHMWEVTSIDYDSSNPEDSTFEITDVTAGNSVEVEADFDHSSDATGTKIIDGQKYVFAVRPNSGDDGDASVEFSWGDGSYLDEGTGTAGTTNTGGGGATYTNYGFDNDPTWDDGGPGATSIYTPIDTESGASVALTKPVNFGAYSLGSPEDFELPSTESTDMQEVTVGFSSNAGNNVQSGNIYAEIDGTVYTSDDTSTSLATGISDDGSTASNTGVLEVEVGGLVYDFYYDATNEELEGVALDENQEVSSDNTGDGSSVVDPAAVVMQPDDDSDNQNAFVLTPGSYDTDDGYSFSSSPTYTGSSISYSEMDSQSDMYVGYSGYGTYVENDRDNEGSVTLNVPSGQAVAGAAVTGGDGSLSAGEGTGSVTSMNPTSWPDAAQLDSDISGTPSTNTILVGGPAVNDLTQQLASDNKTWTGDDYEEGDQVLDLVSDAFTDGNHALVVAGYSGADTRAAANYIADYADNADDLAGQSTLNLATQ